MVSKSLESMLGEMGVFDSQNLVFSSIFHEIGMSDTDASGALGYFQHYLRQHPHAVPDVKTLGRNKDAYAVLKSSHAKTWISKMIDELGLAELVEQTYDSHVSQATTQPISTPIVTSQTVIEPIQTSIQNEQVIESDTADKPDVVLMKEYLTEMDVPVKNHGVARTILMEEAKKDESIAPHIVQRRRWEVLEHTPAVMSWLEEKINDAQIVDRIYAEDTKLKVESSSTISFGEYFTEHGIKQKHRGELREALIKLAKQDETVASYVTKSRRWETLEDVEPVREWMKNKLTSFTTNNQSRETKTASSSAETELIDLRYLFDDVSQGPSRTAARKYLLAAARADESVSGFVKPYKNSHSLEDNGTTRLWLDTFVLSPGWQNQEWKELLPKPKLYEKDTADYINLGTLCLDGNVSQFKRTVLFPAINSGELELEGRLKETASGYKIEKTPANCSEIIKMYNRFKRENRGKPSRRLAHVSNTVY